MNASFEQRAKEIMVKATALLNEVREAETKLDDAEKPTDTQLEDLDTLENYDVWLDGLIANSPVEV